MPSIESDYPIFAQECYDLQPGESAYSGRAEIPFDVHYYRDGWYILWKNPPNGQIGRRLRRPRDLAAFLRGNLNVGRTLPALKIPRIPSL
jgi:hypothetical protein